MYSAAHPVYCRYGRFTHSKHTHVIGLVVPFNFFWRVRGRGYKVDAKTDVWFDMVWEGSLFWGI